MISFNAVILSFPFNSFNSLAWYAYIRNCYLSAVFFQWELRHACFQEAKGNRFISLENIVRYSTCRAVSAARNVNSDTVSTGTNIEYPCTLAVKLTVKACSENAVYDDIGAKHGIFDLSHALLFLLHNIIKRT